MVTLVLFMSLLFHWSIFRIYLLIVHKSSLLLGKTSANMVLIFLPLFYARRGAQHPNTGQKIHCVCLLFYTQFLFYQPLYIFSLFYSEQGAQHPNTGLIFILFPFMFFIGKHLTCAVVKEELICCELSNFWRSTKQLTMAYVVWGGIVGTYPSGTKTTQKAQKWPLETTICSVGLTPWHQRTEHLKNS